METNGSNLGKAKQKVRLAVSFLQNSSMPNLIPNIPFLIVLARGSAGGQNQGNLMLSLLYNEWRTYLLEDFLLRIDMLLLFGVHYVFLLYAFHSKSHVLIFHFNL